MQTRPNLKISSTEDVKITPSILLLGMVFLSLLIASNICSFKVSEIYLTKNLHFELPAAVIFFPLTYLLADVITEVYGFKISRLIIWLGLFCIAIFTFCIWLAVKLPPSTIWLANTNNGQSAFELVLQGSERVFLASALAYFFGEFFNSITLAKLKIKTQGKHFFMRIICSSVIGAAIDTTLFCHIAFFQVLPELLILKIIMTLYFIKIIYETFMSPITLLFSNLLKKIDGMDYYDYHTNFSPFSFKLSN